MQNHESTSIFLYYDQESNHITIIDTEDIKIVCFLLNIFFKNNW